MLVADHFATLRQTRCWSPAITFQGRTHCFGELVAHGWQVGNGLLGIGLPGRERIAILAHNRPEFIELLIGAAASGQALAALDWRLPDLDLIERLDEAGSRVLFVAGEFYERAARMAPQLGRLRHIIALDDGHRRWPDYRRWRDAQRAARPRVRTRGEEELLHLYARGAAGRPRAIGLTQQSYERLFQALLGRRLLAGAAAAVRNMMPMFHLGGVNRSVLPLLRGAHLHLADEAPAPGRGPPPAAARSARQPAGERC
ncbi:MAG: AMP-binding protein [Pseudomonadota bacterium]